jgi:hypothetical protein
MAFNYNSRELIHSEVFMTGFEDFMATKRSEIFLGDQPGENGVNIQHFADCLKIIRY